MAIVNSIPFREEAIDLDALDLYGLLSDGEETASRGDRAPYNPAAMEALQRSLEVS